MCSSASWKKVVEEDEEVVVVVVVGWEQKWEALDSDDNKKDVDGHGVTIPSKGERHLLEPYGIKVVDVVVVVVVVMLRRESQVSSSSIIL